LLGTLTRGDTLPRVTDNATCHTKNLTHDKFKKKFQKKKKIQKNKIKKFKNPEADTWQGS